MRHKKFFFILALLLTVAQGAWADAGDTEDNPITISSESDWDTFATNVNDGTNNYSGKFVKLTADITVSTMVGTSKDNSFQGTFFGDGIHTLTFTKGSSSEPFSAGACAPFRYVNGATIRDLKVAGEIYTTASSATGLVGRLYDTTNITNCHVSTVIHSIINYVSSSTTHSVYHAGIVAIGDGAAVNITGCVYDGRIFTIDMFTKGWGGFITTNGNTNLTISNSLYAPNPNITAAEGEEAVSAGNKDSYTFDCCLYDNMLL